MLIFMLVCPVSPGWGQDYEGQARYYLQDITPKRQPTPPGPLVPTPVVPPKMPTPRVPKPPGYELYRPEVRPPTPPQVLTAAPRQPEEISAAERRAWERRMFIKQFGYSFFYQPPASFLPLQNVPVGPDYVVGPGDTVHIVLWGSIQGDITSTVDRQGRITIPKIGAVHVSGLTFQQLKEALNQEFSRQYTNFQMSVTLDNLRTIQVFVVGQARFPGSYAVSSLSTLVSALFAAGGPSKSGSLRDIQVRRGGKVLVHFDMYDFLLKGDKSRDIRLQNEDVIFIPPVGPLVALGYPKSIQEIEEDLKLVTRLELEELYPGITLPGVKPRIKERAPLGPEVKETLPSLFPKREEKRKFVKPPSTGYLEKEVTLSEKEFEQRFGMSLKEAAQKIALSKRAEVGGPIKIPAIYELKEEKTLTDLLRLAGGLGGQAFKGRVQVLRVKDGRELVLFDEDLSKILAGTQRPVYLADGDMVMIFKVPPQVETKVILAGAVKNPGEYGYKEGLHLKDLVAMAGGLLSYSSREEVEITRTSITPEGPVTSRVYVNLRRALAGRPQDNILLRPNDYVFIRPIPDWDVYQTVRIEGEVKYPGTYAIKKGEPLSSLLSRAGGFTAKAYPLGTVFIRPSVKRLQKEQLKAAIDRAEAAVLALAAERAVTGLEPEEARRAEVVSRQQQQLLARLRKIEPIGRVVVRVDDPERLRGTPWDIELEDGDAIYVPQMPQTVNVVGAVYAPTAVIYQPNRTVKEYIDMAGGTTRIAAEKEIYIIKANGSAVSRRAFNWLGFGKTAAYPGYEYHFGGLKSLTLDPGDTIVVPEKLERIAWLKEIKDITRILANVALVGGVLIAGFR
ncbi:MAG: SLBB domain-containing protein [Deltaproteobacteria bacterium]|nr:SLBB domain-containing protein [Deltaproteobacteria bacterium]